MLYKIAEQRITSAETSINSARVPAVFRKVDWKPGTVNLDIGGGKYDTAYEYLKPYGVVNLVYDPYNRSKKHNSTVAQMVAGGKADTVTISNVLNVIAEKEARTEVLLNALKSVIPGGEVYITVYEGDKSGIGRETTKGYQLNRKLQDYIPEIEEVFGTVTIKNGMIVAIG